MSIVVVSVPMHRRGRPRRCPVDVLIRVIELRVAGARLIDICNELNGDGVPTPGGGLRWYPSYVHRLLHTYDARLLEDGYEVDGRCIGTCPHLDLRQSKGYSNPRARYR